MKNLEFCKGLFIFLNISDLLKISESGSRPIVSKCSDKLPQIPNCKLVYYETSFLQEIKITREEAGLILCKYLKRKVASYLQFKKPKQNQVYFPTKGL